MTLDQLVSYRLSDVQSFFAQGIIGEDLYAEYRHLWQTSAVRFSKVCYCNSCNERKGL